MSYRSRDPRATFSVPFEWFPISIYFFKLVEPAFTAKRMAAKTHVNNGDGLVFIKADGRQFNYPARLWKYAIIAFPTTMIEDLFELILSQELIWKIGGKFWLKQPLVPI